MPHSHRSRSPTALAWADFTRPASASVPHSRPHMLRLPIAVILVLLAAPAAWAQVEVTIQGRVIDQRDGPLQGVSVTATRIVPDDGLQVGATTDLDGQFRLPVPPGTYRLDVTLQGYTTLTTEVTAGPGMTRDLTLILVDASAPRTGLTPTRYFDLNQDNYFLGGVSGRSADRDPMEYASQVKFRVSVRYKVIDWLRCGRCGSGLSATYTQNSFWHLYDPSGPFFDNNYSPGVLAYHDFAERGPSEPAGVDGAPSPRGWRPAVYASVSHESNGRELPFSRGWNRVSVGASLGAVNETPVSGSLTGWHAFGIEDTNADLVDYAGRGAAEVYAHPFMRSSEEPGWLTLHVRSHVFGRTPVTNVEANAMVFPWSGSRLLTPALTVQLFSGYAEHLLTYDERRTVVRFGLAISR